MLAHVVEHRADEALLETARRVDARSRQQVPSDLLADELMEADIVVERADQIVAVLPRPLGRVVPFVAVGVGIADHVHPVPGDSLAEMRRLEKFIDKRLQRGIWVLIEHSRKRLDQLGCRRQTCQHERHPSQQG